MADKSVSMKLLVDTQAKKVLFAEANKECVDLLFQILTLPVSTIISLVKKQGILGSLGNLYESVENLDESYIKRNQSKEALLKPMHLDAASSSVPILLLNGGEAENKGGFVKRLATYMVMDDLVVKPMSTISSISLLKEFNVKEVGVLEERRVNLGMDEAVNLLRASLQSEKVLTKVFLNGNTKESGTTEGRDTTSLMPQPQLAGSGSVACPSAIKKPIISKMIRGTEPVGKKRHHGKKIKNVKKKMSVR